MNPDIFYTEMNPIEIIATIMPVLIDLILLRKLDLFGVLTGRKKSTKEKKGGRALGFLQK